ncbi:hypothetical protein [Alkalicoccus daliensis]|uniref:Uncharacterized protein n=1 Tax=Alkalicoccus daliensis TaxID=745820 RepID=A0A1H0K0K5_9BACI|nr:hypothetical protein [Alkalicoccus daliensis]SDO49414.1 hypothetical protein SAMN04488053_11559 [Alkalicoccus daliensis]
MRFPKVMAALFASILTAVCMPVILPLFDEPGAYFANVLIYALYTSPVIYSYGIAASKLSEFLSGKYHKRFSKFFSFLYHISFGFLFGIPYFLLVDNLIFSEGLLNYISIIGMVAGAIYFLVNEVVMYIYHRQGAALMRENGEELI